MPQLTWQLELRGNEYEDDPVCTAHRRGLTVIERHAYVEESGAVIGRRIRDAVGDSPVYISFDLDCLDPSIAPGVANLEPEAGLCFEDATSLLRSVTWLNVVGADIVCMMPTKDAPNGITDLTAVAVGLDLVNLLAMASLSFPSA